MKTHWPSMPDQIVSEQQTRALRDFVFGVPTTDNNWEHCKDKWMRDDAYRWLEKQAEMIKARTVRKNRYD